jgi:hypothetical protein
MRALRSAAALLRGGAGLALAQQRVLAAGAGAQAAAELARGLDQGCAARHAATAAGGDPGVQLRGAAANVSVAPRRRAPHAGTLNEKTTDGKPKPDERTVADLVGRGWFESEEDAVALLTRKKSQKHRYPSETAKPAADWLEATLGRVRVKGVLPAAKVLALYPDLLQYDAATLRHKWDALTLPAEQGGLGIALSAEQARDAVLRHPPILGYSTDTLKRGWSMLTATEGGLGLSPEEAQKLVLKNPRVLCSDSLTFTKRLELLKSLGYPKAHEMVLTEPRVLNFKEETVREHDAWWKQTGLDHVKILTANPNRLGAPTTAALQANLDFLRCVAGMSTADLNNAGSLIHRSLNDRLRARYFYALLKGRLTRFTSKSTLMAVTDATFLAMLQGQSSKGRASELEVALYREQVASPEFVAWREEQEALLLAAKRLP